jgi:lipoyl(octanoyl) transferase
MMTCQVRILGLMPYQEAWDLQNDLASQIARGDRPPTLLLLEHPHTYTFGRRGQQSNLLLGEAELAERGITVFWVDRGGDVTYHGPGQLVGYPIISLGNDALVGTTPGAAHLPQVDYIGYLRKLEEVIILALRELGVQAGRVKNLTGVWVKGSKIAAIGVKVDSHGITRHGFTLNVAPDMSYWDGIIGCGLSGYTVTSLAQLLSESPSMQLVNQAVITAFEAVFEVMCEVVS